MRKKLLSILLTLALLLSLIPAGYAADIEIVDEPELEISADDVLMIDGAEIHVNPLYRDRISAEEIAASLREAAETAGFFVAEDFEEKEWHAMVIRRRGEA